MFSPVMEGNLYRPQPCSTGDRLNRRAPNEEALITASRFLSPPLQRKRDFDRAPPPFHSSPARRCLPTFAGPCSLRRRCIMHIPATLKRFNDAALRALTNNTARLHFCERVPGVRNEILIRSDVLREQASQFSPNYDNDSLLPPSRPFHHASSLT